MRLNGLSFHSKLGLSGFLMTIMLGLLSAATLIGLLYSSSNSGFNIPEIDKVKAKYSESLLVGAMKSSMYQHVTVDEDIGVVEKWVKDGAPDNDYFNDEVMYIIEADCQKCHSRTSTMTGAIPSMPLNNYDDLLTYTEKGYSWVHMAKSAHIHLLSIAVVMVLVTGIFSLSSFPSMPKTVLICTAWSMLWLDISAWWMAKFSSVFAYVIAGSGALEITALVLMCLLSLYDLWWKKDKKLPE